MFNRFLQVFLCLFGAGLFLPESAMAQATEQAGSTKVYVVPVKDEISGAKLTFLRRVFKEAEREKAAAIILDMDTPGGSLEVTVQIQQALNRLQARTITWVNPNAISAGALIAVSTKEIYMAPVSVIGAAAPVMGGGQDIPATMKEKIVSTYSAYFSGVAERNGYHPEIARAFMDNSVEIKIGETVVHPKGSILSLNAKNATAVYEGKPLLAKGTAATLAELLEKTGLSGSDVVHAVPSGFEQTAFYITRFAPILLTIGFIGLWMELKTPGFGIPGIAAITAFTIFFAGHLMAGLAGWELPVLFVLGLLLVLIELIFFPGLFIVAGFGIVLVVASLIWAMVDRYPSQPLFESVNLLYHPMLNLLIALVIALIAMWLLARYLPKTRLYQSFILDAEIPSGPAFVPQHNEFTDLAIGAEGVACSMLRPSGRGQFDEKPRDVITLGSFVDPGTPIRVIAIEGSRIVVEPFTPSPAASSEK